MTDQRSSKQAERCRCCGEWWDGGGIVCSSFGPRDFDSIRHYCNACVADGAADVVETAITRAANARLGGRPT